MPANPFTAPHPVTCAPGRAARELGLKRSEFELAVHLGRIRTLPDEGGGRGRRVERSELDRLRTQDGFPETLRDRVHVVGTAEGAALMDVSAGRFTRLARLGLLVPVRFYLNRYRTVVWLYLAEELKRFADDTENTHLLKGRTPETLRSQVAAGVDLRARNWRGRHLGFLLRQAEDPWARAGALAAFLAPVEIADLVRDPYERAQLNRCRPAPPDHGAPGSPSACLAEELMTARDPDEISRLRGDLKQAMQEARTHSPARRPAAGPDPYTPRTLALRAEPAPPTSAAPAEPTVRAEVPDIQFAVRAELPTADLAMRTARRCAGPGPSASRQPAPGEHNHERGPRAPRSPRGLRGWLRRRVGARRAQALPEGECTRARISPDMPVR